MKLYHLVTITALAFLPMAAHATDLPSKKSPAPSPAVSSKMKWDGFYIGGNLGSANLATSQYSPEQYVFDDTYDAYDVGSYSGRGLIGGIQIGYDHQINDYVFGVQAQIDVANLNADLMTDLDGWDSERVESDINVFGSATARFGYLVEPQLLVYAKGGLAWAKFQYIDDLIDGDYETIGRGNKTQFGWTAGVGIEYALSSNWSSFVEYNHADFGDQSVDVAYDNDYDYSPWRYDYHSKVDVLSVGVNYRF